MKKFFKIIWNNIKIITGFCLIVASFYYGYNYLNKLFRTPDTDYGDSFHNIPDDSMDMIVLGSSHAQYSFVPSFFYQDTGLYSYLLGSSFQPLNVSYQMLREALKTQKPKLVLLEVFSATYQVDNTNGDYDYRYILAEYQMTGEEKYNTIDYVSTKEKALSYKNEFINNHNNWRTIESVDELLEHNDTIDPYFGYVDNWDVDLPAENYWYSFKYDKDTEIELLDEDLEALNDIYDLCQENGIELMLYMTPMDSVTEDMQTLRHDVWKWADEKGVNYIDFLEEDEKYDIRSYVHHDGFHMYINGASCITDYLSDYIEESYTFNHIDNEELNNLYEGQIASLSTGILTKEYNASKYLRRLINNPGLVIVSYKQSEINDELREYLDKMGLEELNENNKFYGVLYDGSLVQYSNDSLDCDVDGHNIKINNDGIYFDNEFVINDDSLTFVTYNKQYSGRAIRIVDYLDGKLWEKGTTYDYTRNW